MTATVFPLGATANKARVETRGGCTLVFGKLSLPQLRELSRDGSSHDVMSPDLAHLMGATYAYGSAAAVVALLARARAEKLAAPRPAHLAGLEPAAQDWAVAGEIDPSSATVFAWITGIKLDIHYVNPRMPTDFPHDPADLRLCRLLLESVPAFVPHFERVMPTVSPTWAALVAQWSSLCSSMDRECPNWRLPAGHTACRETYQLMQMVREHAHGC